MYCRMAVRGSPVRMPSGHMMSRGQALLAGLSVGSWLHAPSKHDSLTLSKYSSSPPLWSIRLEGGKEAGRSSRPADS